MLAVLALVSALPARADCPEKLEARERAAKSLEADGHPEEVAKLRLDKSCPSAAVVAVPGEAPRHNRLLWTLGGAGIGFSAGAALGFIVGAATAPPQRSHADGPFLNPAGLGDDPFLRGVTFALGGAAAGLFVGALVGAML